MCGPSSEFFSEDDKREKKFKEKMKERGERIFSIPQIGIDPHKINEEVETAIERCRIRYDKGWGDAKPGTLPDVFSYMLAASVVSRVHPNLIDPNMWGGIFELEREVMSMIGGLLHHPNPIRCNAWGTSGGTESMSQIIYTFRNKYFREKQGFIFSEDNKYDNPQIRTKGLQSFTQRPKILAPVDVHFCVERCADLTGLGTDSIVNYELNNNYQTDIESVSEKIDDIYKNGDEILAVITTAGDVCKGRIDRVRDIADLVKEKSAGHYNPPIVVDAAQQFLFSSLMGKKLSHPEWDFGIDGVKAIVLDPHKTPGAVYGGGIVMFRDLELMNETHLSAPYLHNQTDGGYDFVKEMGQLPAISTSRSGHNAVMLWVYLTSKGLTGLTLEAEKMYNLSQKLSKALGSPESPFRVITNSSCPIVSFEMKVGGHEADKRVYDTINESSDQNGYYISHADTMKVRTAEDLRTYRDTRRILELENRVSNFYGLYLQIMNHHTDERVDSLISHLYHVGREVSSNAK